MQPLVHFRRANTGLTRHGFAATAPPAAPTSWLHRGRAPPLEKPRRLPRRPRRRAHASPGPRARLLRRPGASVRGPSLPPARGCRARSSGRWRKSLIQKLSQNRRDACKCLIQKLTEKSAGARKPLIGSENPDLGRPAALQGCRKTLPPFDRRRRCETPGFSPSARDRPRGGFFAPALPVVTVQ